ncbi:helix-turn-helix transcriptional regulator [Brevibacillus dissolubilis]|uniref:helix-turn-helix transcriptional regulator n=1 Tax=Brevibacillus dissolubilis TaxID=1844116 RepID=UPI00159BEFE7|nr:helix-turn-helix transcriptional regulator [Brevibacillus dissolubilis]
MIIDPNVIRIELRQNIQVLLEAKDWKRKQLAKASGLDRVTISNILNSKQTMQLNQLDAITQAFELPQGHFYDYFIAECCNDQGRLRPGKLGEFVLKCSLLNKHRTIGMLMNVLLEDEDQHKIITILLDIAEKLYQTPEKKTALPYYEKIIAIDQKRGERVALSLYRRFMIVKELDLRQKGREAFIQFLPYLNILSQEGSENLLFDAYRQVLLYYEIVEEWKSLLHHAYEFERLSRRTNDRVAWSEALVFQITACIGQRDYLKALQIIEQLSLMGDEYERIAEGKKLLVLITIGRVQQIETYLGWARSREEKVQLIPAAINSYLQHKMIKDASVFMESNGDDLEDGIHATDYDKQGLVMRLIEARSEYYFATGDMFLALFDLGNLIEQSWKLGNIKRMKQLAEKVIHLFMVHLKMMTTVFGNTTKEKDVPPSAKTKGTPDQT